MNLIQSELYKRGYDVEFTEIPGRGIVYEFRFEPNKLFSLRRNVNLETTLKMLDELQSITGNTEELLRHKKTSFHLKDMHNKITILTHLSRRLTM